jgi:glycosyltransferase involved in cell wall biosynthesis
VPVIGTRLGGIPELVEHNRNGLLFTVDDPHDLANQLQRVLNEPELLPLLRAQALTVRTVDEEVDQICDLYADLVGEPIDGSRRLTVSHGR